MFARSFTLYYTLLEVCYLGPFSCLVSFFRPFADACLINPDDPVLVESQSRSQSKVSTATKSLSSPVQLTRPSAELKSHRSWLLSLAKLPQLPVGSV